MMMNINFSFIVIDDGELDCYITQKFLERVDKNLTIKTFQHAEQALGEIRENGASDGAKHTIIFLDLQMPMMSGFKFIEEFEKLPEEVQKNYSIIVLSIVTSATNQSDIDRILNYQKVQGIIEKPLTRDKLFALLNKVELHV